MDTIEYFWRNMRWSLAGLWGKPYAAPAGDDDRNVSMAPKVLAVVYDPVVDPANGLTLSRYMRWQDAGALAAGYVADIAACSGGAVNYSVVKTVTRDAFPVKANGFCYNAAGYLDWAENRRAVNADDEELVDYYQILDDLKKNENLVEQVNSGQVDEVWLFAYPYAGFRESKMAGRCAFECNSEPLTQTDEFTRRFVIMGFSYQVRVGEMLEDFCHRGEAILGHIYRYARGDANLFERFTRYDQKNPGQSEVGTVHYAPNSEKDYDYNNPRMVLSGCADWENFPRFTGARQLVNCLAWGGQPGAPYDPRPHQMWWLSHLPRVTGSSDGISNNWWKYIVDPNRV